MSRARPGRRERNVAVVYRTWAAAISAMLVAACSAPPPSPPRSDARPADCRSTGCPLGETCVSPGGCGRAWTCQGCAWGVTEKVHEFCGCDGKTIRTQTIGCQAFEHAHVGACASTTPDTTPPPGTMPSSKTAVLTCPLRVTTFRLGGPRIEDASVTTPVSTSAGTLVGLVVPTASGFELLTQLVDASGTPRPPTLIRRASTPLAPLLLANASDTSAALVGSQDASGYAYVEVDARGAPVGQRPALPSRWIPAVATATGHASTVGAAWGPRGLVVAAPAGPDGLDLDLVREPLTAGAVRHTIKRAGARVIPSEGGVAAGERADVAVFSRHRGPDDDVLEAVALANGPPLAPRILAESAHGAFEANVAAGPSGFAVVWAAPPHFTTLTMLRLDAAGVPVSSPAPLVTCPSLGVCRFPRVTALGDGWAVTYWDGTGPSLLRADGLGRPIGAPLAIRSGDEVGGMTDAPLAASPHGLAVAWVLRGPAFTSTLDDARRSKGPRLATLTCAAP